MALVSASSIIPPPGIESDPPYPLSLQPSSPSSSSNDSDGSPETSIPIIPTQKGGTVESKGGATSIGLAPLTAAIYKGTRARKVRFYRNGDKFHGGVVYAVSPDRYRTLSSLINDLNRSLADRTALPCGVRFIFALGGTTKVAGVDELLEGRSYVCSSNDLYKHMDYALNETPRNWNFAKHDNPWPLKGASTAGLAPLAPSSTSPPVIPPNSNGAIDGETVAGNSDPGYCRSTRPKLITVIRNGRRPRKSVRFLLNQRTARSLDQVLEALNTVIKLDTGPLRRLYTMEGVKIKTLADLYNDDVVFLACGPEKYSHDDFDLDQSEHKILANCVNPKLPQPINNQGGNIRARSKQRYSLGTPNSINSHNLVQRNGPSTNSNHYHYKSSVPSSGSSDGTSTPDSRSKSPAFSNKASLLSPIPNGSLRRKQNIVLHEESPTNTPDYISDSSTRTQRSPLSNSLRQHDIDRSVYPSFIIRKYEVYDIIGDGNFAVVRECRNRQSKKYFALKIIDKTKCKTAIERQMIANEVSILRRISHPNIVQLLEEYETELQLYLVMELVKGGDLFDAIAAVTKFPEDKASQMIFNLASAVRYLHSQNIVHRDIKPENLLVYEYFDGTKTIKLADFGLAIHVTEPLYTVCGTPAYVAPEILAETGYGIKIDVWAMGVITYILLCGFPPFDNGSENQEDLFDLILTADVEFPDPFWYNVSDAAKNLIKNMLQVDPNKRYSALDVLMHPWILGETRYPPTKQSYRNSQRPAPHHDTGTRASLSPKLLSSASGTGNRNNEFNYPSPKSHGGTYQHFDTAPSHVTMLMAGTGDGNLNNSSTSLHNTNTTNLLYT